MDINFAAHGKKRFRIFDWIVFVCHARETADLQQKIKLNDSFHCHCASVQQKKLMLVFVDFFYLSADDHICAAVFLPVGLKTDGFYFCKTEQMFFD